MSESILPPELARKAELLCIDCKYNVNGNCTVCGYANHSDRLRTGMCVLAESKTGVLEERFILPEQDLLVVVDRKKDHMGPKTGSYSDGERFSVRKYH